MPQGLAMHPALLAATSPHGVLMRSHALEQGCADDDIRAALRCGELRRIRAGTYAWSSAWDQLDVRGRHLLRVHGVALKSATDVVVSHVSALVLHGGPGWDLSLDQVHVTRPDRRGGRRTAGVVQHRGLLGRADVVAIDGLEVTSATRTALDMLALVDVEHALPVLDDFLHRKLTTPAELDECRRRMDSWPGTLTADLAIRLADGRRESVGESRAAYCFYLGGVPRPTPQWSVVDARGSEIARLDFAWPEHGVWVEFDGKEKYLKHRRPGESVVDAVLREKRREERIAGLTGWRCIRIIWADLFHPEALAAYVVGVLRGGPVHTSRRSA